MKLSENQRKILQHILLQARGSIPSFARALSLKEHSIRYAIEEMTSNGVITPFLALNVHSFGLTDYCLFLSRTFSTQGVHQGLLAKLCAAPGCAWVATLGGEYQYTVSYLASDVFELNDFILMLSKDAKSSFFEKSIAIRLSWTMYSPKYLAPTKQSQDKIVRTKTELRYTPDLLDKKILRELIKAPLASDAAIARVVHESPSTVAFRIKRLQKMQLIIGIPYNLNAQAIGMQSYRLLVYERYSNPKLRVELEKFAERHLNVTAFVHCVGDWDYEINIDVADPREVAKITDQVYSQFGADIKVVKALSVLETHKIDQYPFPELETN